MRKMLSDAMIAKLAPPAAGRLEIFDSIVPALALRVTATGACSFIVRGRVKGQPAPIRVTLGDAAVMKPAEARRAASDMLKAMRAGTDPRETKRAALVAVEIERKNAFSAVTEEFIEAHVSKLRSAKTNAVALRRYLVGAWGDRPISSITDDDVGEVITAIVEAGYPAQAKRVLAHAKRLFRWASAPARPRTNRLRVNPAINLGGSDFDIVLTPRGRALSNEELRAIWTAAEALGEPFGPLFKLLLLSGQRRGEVARMTWGEIDLGRDRVWNIPAARMKAKRPHEVPLTAAMVEILAGLSERAHDGECVFSTSFGERPVSGFMAAKVRIDKLIAGARAADGLPPLPPWRLHDIRRAVRTGLGALPSVPHDIRELVIAHVPGVLAQTYDLHAYMDEKRQALTLWGERLARIVEPVENVVALRAAR